MQLVSVGSIGFWTDAGSAPLSGQLPALTADTCLLSWVGGLRLSMEEEEGERALGLLHGLGHSHRPLPPHGFSSLGADLVLPWQPEKLRQHQKGKEK
ncbi:hypothetical protein DPEC_G00024120 [Dallia pectoralis]|uniref:Uncharacterized protein n=1 Tax=Dallia pectoralis TaxID=75939 RepID=A0ACC2HGZ5_DALPE|nr:hypothetical protein DPEC_G00024120 [Dallia pectoralis]